MLGKSILTKKNIFTQLYRFTGEILSLLKTRIKVNVHPLGPPTWVYAMTNFRGTHNLMHGLKVVEKGKTMNV